jgi:hypothetical protein
MFDTILGSPNGYGGVNTSFPKMFCFIRPWSLSPHDRRPKLKKAYQRVCVLAHIALIYVGELPLVAIERLIVSVMTACSLAIYTIIGRARSRVDAVLDRLQFITGRLRPFLRCRATALSRPQRSDNTHRRAPQVRSCRPRLYVLVSSG